jgi:hypothetical protein
MAVLTQLRLLGIAAKHAVKFGMYVFRCGHFEKPR